MACIFTCAITLADDLPDPFQPEDEDSYRALQLETNPYQPTYADVSNDFYLLLGYNHAYDFLNSSLTAYNQYFNVPNPIFVANNAFPSNDHEIKVGVGKQLGHFGLQLAYFQKIIRHDTNATGYSDPDQSNPTPITPSFDKYGGELAFYYIVNPGNSVQFAPLLNLTVADVIYKIDSPGQVAYKKSDIQINPGIGAMLNCYVTHQVAIVFEGHYAIGSNVDRSSGELDGFVGIRINI